MEHDDDRVGRVLSRREVLALLGAAGASVLVAGRPGLATARGHGRRFPACVVRPEQLEGPFFLDEQLERSDIRADPSDGAVSEGAPLDLVIHVSRVGPDGCRPLAGAVVDIWQCDALGLYSGVRDIAGRFDTTGKSFLRGYQVTDDEGAARFRTIYPGWYEGRAVHIHVKVRTAGPGGSIYDFTSQLYFDDAITERVLHRRPYTSRTGAWLRNRQDRIFRAGGDRLMLDLEEGDGGYSASFDLGLQLP